MDLDGLTQQSHLSQLVQVHVSQPQEAGMLALGIGSVVKWMIKLDLFEVFWICWT
jgi:hypothetical protein